MILLPVLCVMLMQVMKALYNARMKKAWNCLPYKKICCLTSKQNALYSSSPNPNKIDLFLKWHCRQKYVWRNWRKRYRNNQYKSLRRHFKTYNFPIALSRVLYSTSVGVSHASLQAAWAAVGSLTNGKPPQRNNHNCYGKSNEDRRILLFISKILLWWNW